MYNTFDHNLRFLWSIFKDFRNQIDPVEISLKQVLKLFCDSWLLEEFYQVISIDHHYQRSPSRSDYANGSYSRSLLTTMGAISLSGHCQVLCVWASPYLKNIILSRIGLTCCR